MQTKITARRTKVSEAIRERAVELVEKVAKKAHRPKHAAYIFDEEHDQKIVEVQLHLAGGKVKVATAEAENFRTAIDRVIDKLQAQVDKETAGAARG